MFVVLSLFRGFELTDVPRDTSAVLQCFCIGSAGGDICRLQDLMMRHGNVVETPTMLTSLFDYLKILQVRRKHG